MDNNTENANVSSESLKQVSNTSTGSAGITGNENTNFDNANTDSVHSDNVGVSGADVVTQPEAPKKSGSKKTVVLIVLLLLIIVAGGGFIVWLINHDKAEETNGTGLGYEANVVTDEDSLQDLVDGMVERAKDGSMALEFKNQATSSDGQNFSCYIANSVKNKYDMYLGIYLTSEESGEQEELYLTQLIKPGSGIESFQTSRKLEPGTYDTVIIFTQVKDDHATIHSQVSVEYTLTVSE
jgi:hypothetical protein